MPRRHSACRASSGVMPRSMSLEHPVADRPLLQGVDVHGDLVGDAVDVPRQRVFERTEEALDRILEEPDQIGERDVLVRLRGKRAGDELRLFGPLAGARLRRPKHRRVEGERHVRYQLAGYDVANVERLQRMMHDDPLADAFRRRGVQSVEQLRHRHRGRSWLAGVGVGAGVGDHQLLGGRPDRVEQQLPVLGAAVALTGHRVARQHVVTVDHAVPRIDPVVEPDQAHHPVRHRPHRHHRAHRERAGAEVRPGRSAREVPIEQRLDVRQSQHRAGPRARIGEHVAELAFHLAALPGVGVADPGEQRDAVGQRGQPVPQRPGAVERAEPSAAGGPRTRRAARRARRDCC